MEIKKTVCVGQDGVKVTVTVEYSDAVAADKMLEPLTKICQSHLTLSTTCGKYIN